MSNTMASRTEARSRTPIVVTIDQTTKVQSPGIESQPFLPDQVFLSVSVESKLAGLESVSLREIPEQPLLYPQIDGYFLTQIETIITQNNLPITLVKNEYNITQHLIGRKK